jgi:hypothetical protein
LVFVQGARVQLQFELEKAVFLLLEH